MSLLEKRILDISYKHKLIHIGSCISVLPILKFIYENKDQNDVIVLSSGHAALALYVCMEFFEKYNAEELLEKYGIHPVRSPGIHVSTGSLGQGICVAVGLAMAKSRNVHVVISDGECAEGSVWEALAFAKKKNLTNLKVYCNINGYAAYEAVDVSYLRKRLETFLPWISCWETANNYSFLSGLDAHYYKIQENDAAVIQEIYS